MNAVGYGVGAATGLVLFVLGNVTGERRGRRNEVARRSARPTVLQPVPVDGEAGRVSDPRKRHPHIRAASDDQARYQHGPPGW